MVPASNTPTFWYEGWLKAGAKWANTVIISGGRNIELSWVDSGLAITILPQVVHLFLLSSSKLYKVELGRSLKLPDWYEARRATIEQSLLKFKHPDIIKA
jgi:hypothetical protein